MALSPIATLIELTGMDFALLTIDDAPAYDPSSDTPHDPGTPTETPVRGVFAKDKTFGVPLMKTAMILTADTSLPATVRDGSAQVAHDDVTWTVSGARKRWYLGEFDGWTLDLDA